MTIRKRKRLQCQALVSTIHTLLVFSGQLCRILQSKFAGFSQNSHLPRSCNILDISARAFAEKLLSDSWLTWHKQRATGRSSRDRQTRETAAVKTYSKKSHSPGSPKRPKVEMGTPVRGARGYTRPRRPLDGLARCARSHAARFARRAGANKI